jgi:hypothetical protein
VTQLQPSSVTFGAIDINHVYATGISSGGYMTSRVANEYSGGLNPNGTVVDTNKPFRAVAIQSGSYQDCVGMTCTIPPTLPATHPPTYFLHDLGDNVVPYSTRTDYYNRISSQFGMAFVGFDDFDTFISHQWDNDLTGNTSGQSINLILKWFNDHR